MIGNMITRMLTSLLGMLLTVTVASAEEPAAARTSWRALLDDYCLACHSGAEPAAGLAFEELSPPGAEAPESAIWTRVLDAVEFAEMPPAGEAAPEEAVRQEWLDGIRRLLAATPHHRSAALRRMNRREYEYTLHDLLGIEVPLYDLLPEDGSVQGFDRVADGLNISSVLLEQYLEASQVAFDAVIRRIRPLPAATRRAELMEIQENIESVDKSKGGTIDVEQSFVKFTPGWPPARIDAAHPIEDGIYRCRVAVWPHDPGERTLAVAIYVGSLFGPETRKLIGIYDVTGSPQDPRIIEFTTHMDAGDTIHILPRIWPEHVTWRDKHEPRPGVGIVWAETHGPLDQAFPSLAQQRLFGQPPSLQMIEDQPIYMRHRKGVKLHVVESSLPREDAERIIREFLPRAFRRPVSDQELQPFVDLTLDRLRAGRSFEQAVRTGITAGLCSPQFLLLNRQPQVDDFELASRWSYFLWSSMPDEELLQLAADGRLRDRHVRQQQLERMLQDPKISRFVEGFTGQWLDLREIEFTTPSQKLYPEFDPLLQEAMLAETRLFFTHVLQQDLAVTNFIDSDFTFVNERLARHYGLHESAGSAIVWHEQLRQLQLPADCERGGVLTQASVLKVTANGTTTSPVLRGAWVLDKILNRPPPPPPPGVPAVEPDIRGATSIREIVEQHRAAEACASCHVRIDPPGFALEQFDAIGGARSFYRTLGDGQSIPGVKGYRRGPDVAPSGRLPDGRSFDDFSEFRRLLIERPEPFYRSLASKLLVYATGRAVTVADRPVVEAIVRQTRSAGGGLKSMIQAVIESELFLQP